MVKPTEHRIRVLLWSMNGAGHHYGGPGMSAFRLYSADTQERFEVSLAHSNPQQAQFELFANQYQLGPGRSTTDKMRFIATGKRWIAQNRDKFDVFHGLEGYSYTSEPAIQAMRCGIPAVVKLATYKMDLADHGGWKQKVGFYKNRREKVKQLSGVIAISQDIVNELLGYGFPESKVVYIPNSVNVHNFRPAQDEKEKQRLKEQLGWLDLPTFVFSGGVNKRKRPHLMLEAIGVLKSQGVDCQLVLCGPDGEADYVEGMKTRAEELKISPQVKWMGFTQDIASVYRAGDVYGLLSANEGLPNALLEAMASGLPSIVTRVSGNTDVLEDGVSGRFAEPTVAEVAEALGNYLRYPELAQQHGTAARQAMKDRFSSEAVLDAHERMFRRIMAGGDAAQ